MQRQAKKTGDYGIGLMIHSVHMTDDVPALNAWYEEVFGGLVFMGVDEPNYLPVEERWAGLLLVSDLCIETMAPKMPADPTKPVGKFYTKYGRHLHSVGYRVDDLAGLGNHMIAEGVYIGKPGGGRLEHVDPVDMTRPETTYFYPHPRDTGGLMVELCALDMPDDPRQLNTWSSQMKMWELGHPLGIKRLAYVTIGVKNLEDAVDIYVKRMQAVPVHDGVDDGGRFRHQILQIGDCLIQLAEPLDGESPIGGHVARWGNMIYGITFKVTDLDSVQTWLARKNIRTERPRDGVVAADPDDCFGAPYFFTTDDIPNDPFAS